MLFIGKHLQGKTIRIVYLGNTGLFWIASSGTNVASKIQCPQNNVQIAETIEITWNQFADYRYGFYDICDYHPDHLLCAVVFRLIFQGTIRIAFE